MTRPKDPAHPRRGPPAPSSERFMPPQQVGEEDVVKTIPGASSAEERMTLESMLAEARANRLAMQASGTCGHRDVASMTAVEARLMAAIAKERLAAESDEEKLVKSKAWRELRDKIVDALEGYPKALEAVLEVLP
jgi:hypothetical protein